MHAEDLKEWLRGVQEEEDPEREGGREGAGYRWRLFVRLVYEVWRTGHIPQLLWVIVVLIPKGSSGYRGIGLLEPIWKVIEAIMDR